MDSEESDQIPSREDSEPADEAEEGSVAQDDEKEAEADFQGDSLQAAQDKIMTELTRLKDDE